MSESEQIILDGNEARQLKDNKTLKNIFAFVNQSLDEKILSCDTKKIGASERLVIGKQILSGLQREIYRMIDAGEVEEFRLQELEPKEKLFRRIVR